VHLAGADPITSHFEPIKLRSGGDHADASGSDSETRARWISEMVDAVRMRKKRKRVRAAMRREHEEASDEARLDHVLKIVSEQGTNGLSAEDKALLQRVSNNLRRNRESRQKDDGKAPL